MDQNFRKIPFVTKFHFLMKNSKSVFSVSYVCSNVFLISILSTQSGTVLATVGRIQIFVPYGEKCLDFSNSCKASSRLS